jgi:Leucine-rich repeat (LRR) protein
MRLDSNGLKGEMPAAVWPALVHLEYLDLNSNTGVNGTLPSSISSLTNLQRLYLSAMSLMGTVPAELAQLSQLTELFIDHNRLEGVLPVLPFDKYDDCGFAQNQFTCPLPGGASSYCQAACAK